jgi:hypothetical protein
MASARIDQKGCRLFTFFLSAVRAKIDFFASRGAAVQATIEVLVIFHLPSSLNHDAYKT